MKWILIVQVVLIASCKHEKPLITKHGTTIIFATGSDGIVMAADSRTSVIDMRIDSNKILPYYDSCQKVFILNGYLFAASGLLQFGDKYMSDIVNDFNSIGGIDQLDCPNTLGAFVSFMDKFYPLSLHPDAKKNAYFCVGYVNDSAYLIGKSAVNHSFSAWDSCGSNSIGSDSMFLKVYKRYDCNKLAVLAEQTIIDYYTKLKKTGTGGPITVAKISKDNKVTFIKNDFSKKPKGEVNPHYPD